MPQLALHTPVGDLSVSDLVQDPTGTKQALGLSRAMLSVKAEGIDYVCVSSGGVVPSAPIPVGPHSL